MNVSKNLYILLMIMSPLLANPWQTYTPTATAPDFQARLGDLWGGKADNVVNGMQRYMPDSSVNDIKRLLIEDYLLETRNSNLLNGLQNTLARSLSSLTQSVDNIPARLVSLWQREIVQLTHALRLEHLAKKAELEKSANQLKAESAKELLVLKLQTTKELFASMGNGIQATLGDRERMMYMSVGLIGIIAGYFVAKHTTELVAKQIEKNVNTPKLLTETSWVNPFTRMKNKAFTQISSLFFSPVRKKLQDEIVLAPAVAKHIEVIARSTKQIHAAGASYQNVLLYGAPGTGKTLFATLLSHHADMDYAILSGPNFDQFDDEESLIQLNALFDWAESRSKGVIIFIDEAETFLGQRSHLSQKSRRLLNAFLHRTGSHSKKCMLMCATNRPDMLDAAVLSRFALKIEFQTPAVEERVKLLRLYLRKEFGHDDFKLPFLQHIAAQAEGFSGREIAQFVVALKAELLGSDTKEVTEKLMASVMSQFVEYHKASSQLKAFA